METQDAKLIFNFRRQKTERTVLEKTDGNQKSRNIKQRKGERDKD